VAPKKNWIVEYAYFNQVKAGGTLEMGNLSLKEVYERINDLNKTTAEMNSPNRNFYYFLKGEAL